MLTRFEANASPKLKAVSEQEVNEHLQALVAPDANEVSVKRAKDFFLFAERASILHAIAVEFAAPKA